MQSVFIPAKTNRGARDLSSLQRRSWRMRREVDRGRLVLFGNARILACTNPEKRISHA